MTKKKSKKPDGPELLGTIGPPNVHLLPGETATLTLTTDTAPGTAPPFFYVHPGMETQTAVPYSICNDILPTNSLGPGPVGDSLTYDDLWEQEKKGTQCEHYSGWDDKCRDLALYKTPYGTADGLVEAYDDKIVCTATGHDLFVVDTLGEPGAWRLAELVIPRSADVVGLAMGVAKLPKQPTPSLKTHPDWYGIFPRAAGGWSKHIPKIALSRVAADFYLLSNLVLDFPDIRPDYEAYVANVAKTFEVYVVLAVGGELRHARTESSLCNYKVHGGMPELSDWLMQYACLARGAGEARNNARTKAGERLLKSYQSGDVDKIELIDKVASAFKDLRWTGSYGGDKWGQAADCLSMYLKEETTATIFVDTMFGIQHNGGCIFSTAYTTTFVEHILNWNQSGQMDYLRPYATEIFHGVERKVRG